MTKRFIAMLFIGGVLLVGTLSLIYSAPNKYHSSNYNYTNGTSINYSNSPQLSARQSLALKSSLDLGTRFSTQFSPASQSSKRLGGNLSSQNIHLLSGSELRQSLTKHTPAHRDSKQTSYKISSSKKGSHSKLYTAKASTQSQGTGLSNTTISQTSHFTASTATAFQSISSPRIAQNHISSSSTQFNEIEAPTIMYTWSSQDNVPDFTPGLDENDGGSDDSDLTNLAADGFTVVTAANIPTGSIICPTCGGDGCVAAESSAVGSPFVVCPTCHGLGYITDSATPINHTYILVIMGLVYTLYLGSRKRDLF